MPPRLKKTPAPHTLALPSFPSAYWDHILASLEEGLVIIDRHQRVVFFNPAAEQLVGCSQSQALSAVYTEVLAPHPWVIGIVRRALVSGPSPTAGEGELRHRLRPATPIRLTCSPVFTDEGVPLGAVVVLHDLTHQRELAKDVHQADRLDELGVVAAGLAHEIKNPLAGIRGAAQLLQGRVRHDPSAAEYSAVMIREIDRLSGLLERVLQLSPHAGSDPHPLNVHKVLTEVLLLEREAAPAGVKVVTQFDPSLPDVRGDEAQLAQVFRNLMKNGLQALDGTRGGVLTVSTRMATDFHILRSPAQTGLPAQPTPATPGRLSRFLTVDFADNGPGIAPEHLAQLFTPFFTTKTHGTGLGLAISQRIVMQHGGAIRAESAQGQGALFHVLLPVSFPHL